MMWSGHLYLNRKLDHAVSDVRRSEGIQSLLFTEDNILHNACSESKVQREKKGVYGVWKVQSPLR